MRRRSLRALTLAALIGLPASASPTSETGFLSAVDWFGAGKLFGGFSAIAVTEGGAGFLAISDHGGWVRGQLKRDAAGNLTGITAGKVMPLFGPDGSPLKRGQTDSEGVALAPDGTMFVSFEGPARIRRYAEPGAAAENLPSPREFAAMGRNTSLESLCLGPDGSLYTLQEETGREDRPFPVYRYRNGHWDRPGILPRRDAFRAVDCSFGPDGRFYLLERAFHGFMGFASRLRRFELTPAGFSAETVIFQTDTGSFDDLEGLSVWRDEAGGLRATLVSDNNFSSIFTTQIAEFALPD